jgi:lipopolysaccharide/colanic/teichoic acid biosynthesis glycosyltransferase
MADSIKMPMQYSNRDLLLVGVDCLLIAIAVLLANWIRLGNFVKISNGFYSVASLLSVPIILQAAYFFSNLHQFRFKRDLSFFWMASGIIQANAIGFLIISVLFYIVPSMSFGRGILAISFVLISAFTICWRYIYIRIIRNKLMAQKIFLIGCGKLANSIINDLMQRHDNLYVIVGVLDLSKSDTNSLDPGLSHNPLNKRAEQLGVTYLIDIDNILEHIDKSGAHKVVVAVDNKRDGLPINSLLKIRMTGVTVQWGENFFEQLTGRVLADRVGSNWQLFYKPVEKSNNGYFLKRIADILMSIPACVFAMPFVAIYLFFFKLSSNISVFRHKICVGKYGHKFTVYEFNDIGLRTSSTNDKKLKKLLRYLCSLILKAGLNKLPMFWSVLKGDMSLVGPELMDKKEADKLIEINKSYQLRFNVKPGMIGWFSVCEPFQTSDETTAFNIDYDLYYVKYISLTLDAFIMVKAAKFATSRLLGKPALVTS